MLAVANPSFSSFLVQATNPSSTKSLSFATPLMALSHHEKFTPANFAKLSRLIVTVGFSVTKHLPVQCNCLNSSANVEIVMVSGLIYSFLGEMGFGEKETSLLLKQNPALRFASFDSIQARVLLLQSVGIRGIDLYSLMEKCPDVLTAKEIDPLMHFLLNDLEGEVEPRQLKRLLITTDPRFLVDFDQKVKLLIDHGVPQEMVVHVLNNVNLSKTLCLKSIEEIDRKLTFVTRFGGIDIIIRRPSILNFDLDTQLIPRVELLMEISGGDEDAIGILLCKLPAILSYSVKHIAGHIELFRSFAGLTDPQIFKLFRVFPNVISASKERKLRPRIEFLKQCGLNSDEISKFLTKAPVFLGLSFKENLVHKLVVLVKLGYENGTKELAAAMGAASRTRRENLQNVIGLFLSYGLSYAHILLMSKKHPQILQYRYAALEEKLEFLVEEMGRDITELLSFPAFLGYNLDERIKHRYELKKMTLGEGMSINKLLSVSEDSFSYQTKNREPVPEEQPELRMQVS